MPDGRTPKVCALDYTCHLSEMLKHYILNFLILYRHVTVPDLVSDTRDRLTAEIKKG